MIKKLRIAVDHGNRNMKTCNKVFTTGIEENDLKPSSDTEYLTYQDVYKRQICISIRCIRL